MTFLKAILIAVLVLIGTVTCLAQGAITFSQHACGQIICIGE